MIPNQFCQKSYPHFAPRVQTRKRWPTWFLQLLALNPFPFLPLWVVDDTNWIQCTNKVLEEETLASGFTSTDWQCKAFLTQMFSTQMTRRIQIHLNATISFSSIIRQKVINWKMPLTKKLLQILGTQTSQKAVVFATEHTNTFRIWVPNF